MADNALIRPFGTLRRSSPIELMAQIAFGAFLVLIIVGLNPFASSESLAAGLIATGDGDLVRQISFIIAFVIVVGFAFLIRGPAALKAFPISLVIVLLWCFISISWAIVPGIAARRALLTFILACCVMCGVDSLGTQRSLQVLRLVLAAVLIVDLLSLFLIPQAVHLPGEIEAELAGNWRGLHNHKNIAGPIAALSALLFFHYGLASRRWRDWALFVAAVVFMIGTQSKTAIGFFLASIVLSTAYRQMARTEGGRQLFMVFFIGMLGFATIGWFVFYETIADVMSDPTGFTGRVAIWQKVFLYVRENPFLGAGFGSFWGVGETSPAQALSPAERWIEMIPHSHNGYLEILVTIGAIGLFFSVVAFIIIPIKELLARNNYDIDLKAFLFSFICFFVFANLLETIYLNRDRPEWVIFLIVLAVMRQMSANSGTARPSLVMSRSRRNKFPASPS